MLVLLGIGFLAGIITALSPCVLPVLPILLAGGATGGRRRPYAIVAGIVLSFTVFTLAAAWLLDLLGLPEDVLRNLAIALLFVLAATLIFPRFGLLLERPLARLTRRRGGDLGGGFLLGASLGLVFVPCAGPVLATISVLAAQHKVGFEAVLLTFVYALGAAVPMLFVAIGGQRAAGRLRAHGLALRRAMGVVVALAALALVFNTEQSLQVALGGYTSALQRHTEATGSAEARLARLRHAPHKTSTAGYRAAPEFKDIAHWLNTPGDRPLTIAGLRGKVVLVDFWTYSCINCIRTLPHLRAWYAAYHPLGLEIVGVHTPEFAFEHVLGNVRRATHDLHVTWPVALDNEYGTWNAYSNEYWPAEYLIDRSGHVRHVHFGEGDYGGSEQEIRVAARTEREAAAVAADEGRRPHADRAGDARVLPRLRAAAALQRLEDRPQPARLLPLPVRARRRRARLRGRLDGRAAVDRRRASAPASASTSRPATSTSCSADRATSRA